MMYISPSHDADANDASASKGAHGAGNHQKEKAFALGTSAEEGGAEEP